ncbi:MAG: SusD/RagB family nutrient-binding outer membrane lipoprotein [Paludibacter sp.]|nr:SusD/RagB family nutrient-binding outer membrane lipoprotein [Paludibacter sp.]
MKIINQFKKSICILLVAMITVSSCTDNFEEINTDKNKMTAVQPMSMLTPVLYYSQGVMSSRHHRLFSQLMQYSVQINGFEAISQYTIKDSDPKYIWTNLYRRANDVNDMCIKAEQYNVPYAIAIGYITRAWLMSNITDIFGEVPYSEAFKVMDGILQPKFDAQEDIYRSLLNDLDSANTILSTSTTMTNADITFDILYNGNTANWRKFANSLRLRLLTRISKRTEFILDNGNNPAQELARMVADIRTYPIFTSVSDAAIIKFSGIEPFVNPFYSLKSTEFSGNYRMCSRMVDLMNTTGDQRRGKYMTSVGGAYYGIESGHGNAYIIDAIDNGGIGVSRFSANLQAISTSQAIMTYSELQFILAEAAFKGWISTDLTAEDYYKRAIKASFDEWSVTLSNSGKELFIAQDQVRFNGTLERIMEQKWLSLFFVGAESWYDFNRTGFPVLPKGSELDNNGILPTRLRYPSILQSVNTTNYEAAVSRLGGLNDMESKLWWAKD